MGNLSEVNLLLIIIVIPVLVELGSFFLEDCY